MVDLTSEMAELWASLGPPPPGVGRVIQFASARRGEGTSTVAREFARYAAGRGRRGAWLVDLDLIGGHQHATFAADPVTYGRLGKQAAASPDNSAFFTVLPPALGPGRRAIPDSAYIVAHPVEGSSLWITRFRRELMRPNQSVHVTPTGDYWNMLRRHTDLIVIDGLSADRSQACLSVAPYADSTILVVAADAGDARAPNALKGAITASGGRCAGLFVNRVRVETPTFLRAVMP